MSESVKVRFTLFGGLRGFRNGREFELPRKTAGIYLRLFLLSGDLFLDNAPGRRLGTSSSIRTLLVKANKPSMVGQWSREDFFARSGLELKYRERAGICLVGSEWSSDVREFEAIWKRRATASAEELEAAVQLSDPGINLGEWPPHRVLADCWNWADERVQAILEAREDIFAELKRRQPTSAGGEADDSLEGAAGGLKQEGTIPVETSGSPTTAGEPANELQPSTSLRDPLGQAGDKVATPPLTEDDPLADDANKAVAVPRTGTEPWLIEWINSNSATWNMEKLRELRDRYPCDASEIEIVFRTVVYYAREMVRSDPLRANGLFPRGLRARLKRAELASTPSVRRDKPSPIEMKALLDSADEKAWNAILSTEQLRREYAEQGSKSMSEAEKKLYRAGFFRSCRLVEKRYRELERLKWQCENQNPPQNRAQLLEGIRREMDDLWDFLLGLIHLQNFRVLESQAKERRTGGLDPRSIPAIPGENAAARRARADKKVWEAEVLRDMIVLPDWDQPLALDIALVHRNWIDMIKGNLAREKAEREARNAAKREPFKPVRDRGTGAYALLLVPASIASGWVTFVGLGSLGTYIFVQLGWGRLGGMAPVGPDGTPTFSSFVMPSVLISAILGLPVWLPMSYAYFVKYMQAFSDRDIRSSFGSLTVCLLIAIVSLIALAIAFH